MSKTTRARYTLEYKLEAVRLVKGGQSMAVTAKVLGVAEQTLSTGSRPIGNAGSKDLAASR